MLRNTILSVSVLLLTLISTSMAVEKQDFMVNEEDFVGAFRQDEVSAACDAAGNYVVVWRDFRAPTAGVYFQRFNASGEPLGANQFVGEVRGSSSSNPGNPSVAMNATGQFAVICLPDYQQVQVYRFNGDGTPYDTPLEITDIGLDVQYCYDADIAINNSGHIAAVFRGKLVGDDEPRLLGQSMDFSAGLVGDNFIISQNRNSPLSVCEDAPCVSLTESDHVFSLFEVLVGDYFVGIAYSLYEFGSSTPPAEILLDSSLSVDEDYRYEIEFPLLTVNGGGLACMAWSGSHYDWIGLNSYEFQGDTSYVQLVDTNGAVLVERMGLMEHTSMMMTHDHGDVIPFGTGFGLSGYQDESFFLLDFDVSGAPGTVITLTPDDISAWHRHVAVVPTTGTTVALAWMSFESSEDEADVYTKGFNATGEMDFAQSLVNDDIGSSQSFPVVACDQDGWVLAVWIDYRESYQGDVFGQIFDELGNPVGGNFRINDDPAGHGQCAQVELASNGSNRAVAIWTENSTVEYQVFDFPEFTPVGGNAAAIDVGYHYNSFWPDVGVASDKSFVVVWRQRENTESYVTNAYCRRYDVGATPIGVAEQINESAGTEIGWGSEGLQFDYAPRIAMSADGSHAIGWIEVYDNPTTPWPEDYGIFAQFYDASGSASGSNVMINNDNHWGIASTGNEEIPPDVAVNQLGEYAFAWTGCCNSELDGLWARIYDNDGIALGPEIHYYQHDDFTTSPTARVVAGPGHQFMGVWYNVGAEDPDILAQRFLPNGDLLESTEIISSDETGATQSYPSATSGADGLYFVWEDYRNGSGNSDIFARFSDLSSLFDCCGIYTDGITGNANCSDDGKLTLSDVSRMIDRVYISKELLCCEANGNTNADAECQITLSDITRLIDAVFISKNDPEGCMAECEL